MRTSKRKRGVTSNDNESDIVDESNMSKIRLKLLVDTKSNKVVFAEAGKEFVDFLFHIMSLPIGTIIKLLNVKDMVGCLGSLYKSIESLNIDYFNVGINKDAVLKATAPIDVPLLSLSYDEAPASPTTKKFFLCSVCLTANGYVTDCQGAGCPICGRQMSRALNYFRPTGLGNVASSSTSTTESGSGSGGYVKGLVTYMVMDDLTVKPLSTIAGITAMNRFRVKDVSALQEKEVKVGLKEGLAMLKACLETNTVLTSVFLEKMRSRPLLSTPVTRS